MKEAEDRFQAKIDKQLKTLSEAIEEYKHQFGMSPPRGFDKWREIAMKNNAVVVDKYNSLMHNLAPTYALRGQKDLGDSQTETKTHPVLDPVWTVKGGPTTVTRAHELLSHQQVLPLNLVFFLVLLIHTSELLIPSALHL
ncbi:hypothetical protein F5880DRAFT_1671526 [Lentinula raphanica]|nr:hypothetical protein F5880DRAFT_1671526 [Lentinula raphanica]